MPRPFKNFVVTVYGYGDAVLYRRLRRVRSFADLETEMTRRFPHWQEIDCTVPDAVRSLPRHGLPTTEAR